MIVICLVVVLRGVMVLKEIFFCEVEYVVLDEVLWYLIQYFE